jgi:hypothetical protein
MLNFTIRLAACAFVLIPSLAVAQVPGTNDPDFKEVVAYTLTLPALQKVMQATTNMAEAAKNDPRYQKQAALKAEIEKLEQKDERTEAEDARLEKLHADIEQLEQSSNPTDNNSQTLSQMAAAIEREPLAAKALASAGISAREYAKFMLAYFQAGMVAGMMKQGLVKEVPKDLASSINMENVKFVQEHEGELQAFAETMKKYQKP